jgi:hypothetical protein
MAKLRAPANGAPVHWRGKVYEIRRDGSVQVPDEAVTPLLAHGFMPWPAGEIARMREG